MVIVHRSRVGPGHSYSDNSEVSDARHMGPGRADVKKLPYALLIGLTTVKVLVKSSAMSNRAAEALIQCLFYWLGGSSCVKRFSVSTRWSPFILLDFPAWNIMWPIIAGMNLF